MTLKDADELIKLIDDDIASLDFMDMAMSRESYDVCLCTLQMVKQYIKALPTIEAEPVRHGWWIEDFVEYECSVCGGRISDSTLADNLKPNYCPNCGARMDGGEE